MPFAPRQRGSHGLQTGRGRSLGLKGQDGPISRMLPCCGSPQGSACAKPAPLRASTPTRPLWASPQPPSNDLPQGHYESCLTPVAARFRGSFLLLRQVSRCILGYQHAGPRDAVFYNRNFGSCVVRFGCNVVAYAPSAGGAKNDPSDCRVLRPRRE